MEKVTKPLLLIERWSQDPNRRHPFKVDSLQYRPFDLAMKPEGRPHPFSVEASMEGN